MEEAASVEAPHSEGVVVTEEAFWCWLQCPVPPWNAVGVWEVQMRLGQPACPLERLGLECLQVWAPAPQQPLWADSVLQCWWGLGAGWLPVKNPKALEILWVHGQVEHMLHLLLYFLVVPALQAVGEQLALPSPQELPEHHPLDEYYDPHLLLHPHVGGLTAQPLHQHFPFDSLQ